MTMENLDTTGMAGEIVATCRLMMSTGLVVGTWGNVSRRCSPESFQITPSGIPYQELRPGDMVTVDLQSGNRNGSLRPSTETPLHVAIYRSRPDVGAIVHTHSSYAAVFAVNRTEIPPLLEEMAQLVGGGVRVAPYATAGTAELAEGAVDALRGRAAVLLANHGLVGVGRTLKDALTVCQVVEKSAQVFLWAKMSGTPYVLGEQEVQKLRQGFLQNYGQRTGTDPKQ
jgi:L-fuculose-phosphate aldolase